LRDYEQLWTDRFELLDDVLDELKEDNGDDDDDH
jgi:hypothetical protein